MASSALDRVFFSEIVIRCPWHLLTGPEPAFCWQDGPERDVWFALGQAQEFDNLASCREAVNQIEGRTPIPPRGFAFFSFDPAQPQWPFFPAQRIVLPEILVRWRDGKASVLSAGSELPDLTGRDPSLHPSSSALSEHSHFSRADWRSAVQTVRKEIEGGALEKVVLSRQVTFSADSPFHAAAVLARLSENMVDSILFACSEPGGGVFLGATPERLFRLRTSRLAVDSLAGTRRRGKDAPEDRLLAEELLQSAKDRHEQELVTQHILSKLRPHCVKVSMENTPHIRKLSTVQHLHTAVEADVSPSTSLDGLLHALHPTPATCGLPVSRARELIAALEPEPRGLYAGVVGWIGSDEAEFAVAIRSGLIRDNTARLFGGAGIVAKSEADSEYEECAWKMDTLRRAL